MIHPAVKAPILRGDIEVKTDVRVVANFSEPDIGRIATYFTPDFPDDPMSTEPCPAGTRGYGVYCNMRTAATTNEDGSTRVCASCTGCSTPAWPREIVDAIIERTEERASAGDYM